jgi:hypothetical protein
VSADRLVALCGVLTLDRPRALPLAPGQVMMIHTSEEFDEFGAGDLDDPL